MIDVCIKKNIIDANQYNKSITQYTCTTYSTQTFTIKVSGVVGRINKLLKGEMIAKHRLLLDLIEKDLQTLLSLYQKLTVCVTKELLGRKGKGISLNLKIRQANSQHLLVME